MYLDKCLSDLKFCTFSLQNVESIKKIHEANLLKDIFNAGEMTLVADVVRECVVKQEAKILSLRLEVPILLIKENEDFAFLVAEIAKQWVYYQNALNARYNVYDRSMTESALEVYKSRLNLIKQGLPEKYINVIDENSLTSENKSADKNGCYIATSIYGSYDCPQVWTLRRFRDNVLDEYLLGRIFIKIYYAISPVMVKLFGETTLFKLMFNSILNRMVSNLNNKGFEDTPYNDKY